MRLLCAPQAAKTTIKAIKKRYEQLGIKLALDDYGAGYSNVINLLQYVPEYVKIDHSLINEINKHPKKLRFVREIIDFCHDNGILALAEGVETWTELRCVVRMGVDLIQGFYTAMPSPEIIREIENDVKRGKCLMNVNCNSGVGMGSFAGSQEISISDCEFEISIAVTKGVGIGSLTGESCNIKFNDGVFYSDMKGEYITAVGSLRADTDFSQERATLKITGSGANALAFGGLGENTHMDFSSSDVSVELMTATQRDTYAPEENLNIRNGKYRFMVNGYPYKHEIQ